MLGGAAVGILRRRRPVPAPRSPRRVLRVAGRGVRADRTEERGRRHGRSARGGLSARARRRRRRVDGERHRGARSEPRHTGSRLDRRIARDGQRPHRPNASRGALPVATSPAGHV